MGTSGQVFASKAALRACLFIAGAIVILAAARSAQAQTETILHNFGGTQNGIVDGYQPSAALARDSEGNLYGTTTNAYNGGIIYELSTAGVETILHRFSGPDGSVPNGGLIFDSAGNLYGTTELGGADNVGTIFKLAKDGTLSVLYSFSADAGNSPTGRLVMDSAGNLFGTDAYNGANPTAVLFELTPDGAEQQLYEFAASPFGALSIDADGTLYGAAEGSSYPIEGGYIYKFIPGGGSNPFSVLYSFTESNGIYPNGSNPNDGLAMDAEGNIYGTTQGGGSKAGGTVFKLAPDGTETVLYNFNGITATDSATPRTGLIRDTGGNLYGTTTGGGIGGGSVFELTHSGQLKELHVFQPRGSISDGSYPVSKLVHDADWNLYGTTSYGGAYNGGIVYKITPGATPVPTDPPTFTPAPGFYSDLQIITISDDIPGSQVYYTTSYGDTPTIQSNMYIGPVYANSTHSIAAIAIAPGQSASAPTYAYYGFRVNEPAFNYGGGRYSGPVSLAISDITYGAVIYYTTDGSTPTANSALYSVPITVSKSETVRAIGILVGYENSTVAATSITIY